MARYGIVARNVYGISLARLRKLAAQTGRNHALARSLWSSGVFEARLLAFLIDEPDRVTPSQMDRWARQFDNWAITDGCCLHLFVRTPYAWQKAAAWSNHPKEFVRRAAFSLMAVLTVHDKESPDRRFLRFLPLIRRAATDERNGVKKGVSWALRQIGKRSLTLNRKARACAGSLRRLDTPAARWIAADALRELTSEAVQRRLRSRARSPRTTS
jgi:3-methyladenine DNA glycosylase AlkD